MSRTRNLFIIAYFFVYIVFLFYEIATNASCNQLLFECAKMHFPHLNCCSEAIYSNTSPPFLKLFSMFAYYFGNILATTPTF